MEELVFFIINLIAEALGLKKKRPPLPLVPRAPSGPRPPSGMPMRPPLAPGLPRTIARPAGDDQSLVPQPATTLGFAERVSASLEPGPSVFAARTARPAAAAPPPSVPRSPLTSLFVSNDDFVRAFVMQEILQPPRARRPHRPPSPE